MGLELLLKLWGTVGSVARSFTPSFLRETDQKKGENKQIDRTTQEEENSVYSPEIENYSTTHAQNTVPTPLQPNIYWSFPPQFVGYSPDYTIQSFDSEYADSPREKPQGYPEFLIMATRVRSLGTNDQSVPVQRCASRWPIFGSGECHGKPTIVSEAQDRGSPRRQDRRFKRLPGPRCH